MILATADQLPFLPLLVLDVSLEHSHRRTTRDGGPADDVERVRPNRLRRRLSALATALLAVGR
jgi:hypothetical protein